MKTIAVTYFIGIFLSSSVYSQTVLTSQNDDTLLFFHRTGGNIDTFDLTYTFPLTTVPGGSFSERNSATQIDFLLKSPSLFNSLAPQLTNNWRLSALPHIGFFYSFGTKGTQFLHTDYQQQFKNKALLNIDINRSSASKGMARQSDFAHQDFHVGYRIKKKYFSGILKGMYQQNAITQSGGLLYDSLSIQQGLQFARTLKANAESLQKFALVDAEMKFNFLQDTSLTKMGLYTHHQYSVWNRIYSEVSDTLSGLYPEINIDSNSTHDQFQDAKLQNGAGIFLDRKHFSFTGGIFHRYWRFQNLGTNRDTNEISGEMALRIQKQKWDFKTTNYVNFIGAKNEYFSRNKLKWGTGSRFLFASFSTESMLPALVQRFYYANSTHYETALNKQNRTDLQIGGGYSFWKVDLNVTVGSLIWQNNLQWVKNSWGMGSQSTMTNNYIKAKLHFDFNWFHFYPELQVNQGISYLPKGILSGRLLVKKKVFAAKKLELLFALDPQLTDRYQLLTYNTVLDNWYFDDLNRFGGQKFSLHATISMAIEEFRFFIRTENIQSFWNPNDIEIQQNFYRPAFLLRLGISWDFFN
ncbi:MAG: putative porin [Crocinitomicaceae bacterium]